MTAVWAWAAVLLAAAAIVTDRTSVAGAAITLATLAVVSAHRETR